MSLGNDISLPYFFLLSGPGTEEECQKDNPSCVGTQAPGSIGHETFMANFLANAGLEPTTLIFRFSYEMGHSSI